jgi:hypothetical protein
MDALAGHYLVRLVSVAGEDMAAVDAVGRLGRAGTASDALTRRSRELVVAERLAD